MYYWVPKFCQYNLFQFLDANHLIRIDENKFFYLVKIQKLDLGAVRTKDAMSPDSDNWI